LKNRLRKLIIFDLDGTLYSNNSILFSNIDKYTEKFLKDYFYGDIVELEKNNPNILSVIKKLGISRERYGKKVFTKLDYQMLIADKKLSNLLDNIDSYKCIVSLAPISHIEEVLDKLGISNSFDLNLSIYDLGIENKKDAYLFLLDMFSVVPNRAVCVGDSFSNDLIPAKELKIKNIYLITNKKEIKDKSVKNFLNIYRCLEYILENEDIIWR
jgi:hypothetical protein